MCGVIGGLIFVAGCFSLFLHIRRKRATPFAKEEDARMVDPFVLPRPDCRNPTDVLRDVRPEDFLMARWTIHQSNEEEHIVAAVPVEMNGASPQRRASGLSTGHATAGSSYDREDSEKTSASASPDADMETHSKMVRKLAMIQADLARWRAGTRGHHDS